MTCLSGFQGDGILDDASLRELGIGNDEHRTVLCRAAASLTTPLQKMSTCPPSSVEEWLHLLRLPHYVDHFKKNCFDEMERVRRVWEVELTTVIEIRLLGHLRRILVSLGNQRINGPSISQAADHPSVAKCTETAENLSELTSDLQKIVSLSLCSDESPKADNCSPNSSKMFGSSNLVSRFRLQLRITLKFSFAFHRYAYHLIALEKLYQRPFKSNLIRLRVGMQNADNEGRPIIKFVERFKSHRKLQVKTVEMVFHPPEGFPPEVTPLTPTIRPLTTSH